MCLPRSEEVRGALAPVCCDTAPCSELLVSVGETQQPWGFWAKLGSGSALVTVRGCCSAETNAEVG